MIQIKTIRLDDVDDLKIRICFNNDICTSCIDIWGQSDIFYDFAKELADFPFGTSKSIHFKYGEDNNKWAYYLLITVDVFDPSGKILIKILMDNKGEDIDHYRCEFPIKTDITTINNLGRQLTNWTPIENETWSFSDGQLH